MKVFFSLVFSYILMPGINYSTIASSINGNLSFALLCVNEVMSGLLLGYMVSLCFSFIRMAGSFVDMQIGLSMLSMFDPNSKSNATLLDRLMYWTALTIFFIVDGHHMLINALIESFSVVNLGKSMLNGDSLMFVVDVFIKYFAIGIKITLPIVLIIIIADLTLALISRTVPQINVMILGLPIKILVGLASFSLALPLLIKGIVAAFSHIPEILRQVYKFAPLMIIFASEDKTEEATPRKKREARKKGQVPKSKEIGLVLTLLTCTILIDLLSSFASGNLKSTFYYFLNDGIKQDLTYNNLKAISLKFLWRFAIIYLPIALPIMVVGILANYMQTGFLFTTEPLKPKLSKLNPINGFKRIFSMRTLVELLKDLVLVTIVGYVGYKFLKDNYVNILNMGNLSIVAIGPAFKSLVVSIFKKITMIMAVIALADYIYQRRTYNKDLKMTKQEVKEEYKQDEGDPQIKGKIRQKQREMAARRMMQAVPDATVVVTNPTHIAVALKYKEGETEAPIVLAKGAGYVAIKIKEIAKESEIPIIENKPLARLMYEEVDINSEIPTGMYQAVAEILALVYKLKGKKL